MLVAFKATLFFSSFPFHLLPTSTAPPQREREIIFSVTLPSLDFPTSQSHNIIKKQMMTTTESFHIPAIEQQHPSDPKKLRHSCARRCVLIFLPILILILIINLILAFTVFKAKDPTTEIVSATLDGISPQVVLPQLNLELNITLDLKILVHNPNHVSFKHGPGSASVYYHGTQVAVADISPGTIAASGSETLTSKLILEADQFMDQISGIVKDVLAGEFEVETKSKVPGQVKFLGIFHKHVITLSDCRIVVGTSDLKVRRQECSNKIKF